MSRRLEDIDEFDELAATIADEVIPAKVPVSDAYAAEVADAVLRFIVTDPEMRALLERLLKVVPAASLLRQEQKTQERQP